MPSLFTCGREGIDGGPVLVALEEGGEVDHPVAVRLHCGSRRRAPRAVFAVAAAAGRVNEVSDDDVHRRVLGRRDLRQGLGGVVIIIQ